MTKSIFSSGILFFFMTLALTTAFPIAASNKSSQYQTIEWTALIPQDDLDALLNPPEYLDDIVDGSQQDSVDAFTNKQLDDEQAQRFRQALVSTQVITTLKDKRIRIPGFIVPLESDEQQRVTEFFIVPYFGACLHMPPPPPNQIIYASHTPGIELDNLYDPFWFEGTLKISTQVNAVGTSAYKLELDHAYLYEEK